MESQVSGASYAQARICVLCLRKICATINKPAYDNDISSIKNI